MSRPLIDVDDTAHRNAEAGRPRVLARSCDFIHLEYYALLSTVSHSAPFIYGARQGAAAGTGRALSAEYRNTLTCDDFSALHHNLHARGAHDHEPRRPEAPFCARDRSDRTPVSCVFRTVVCALQTRVCRYGTATGGRG